MPFIGDIGLDLISDRDLVQFGALVHVNLRFFPVIVFDPVILSVHFHQCTLHRVLGQSFPHRWLGLFIGHRIGCLGKPNAEKYRRRED